MLRLFPLLAIPVALYNLFALGGTVAGHHDIQELITSTFQITMFSGDPWKISFSDFLLMFGLVMLFIEVVKATRSSSKQLINHGLSMVVFVVALIEFITLKGFATSTFFFLVMFTLFDVIAGYTISVVSAEHDLGIGRTRAD
jgi:hypothetical protein